MPLAFYQPLYRRCRFLLVSLAIVAACTTGTVRPAGAQQFHDCEGVPGEYLAKYKSTATDTPMKRLSATTNTRNGLRARVVREYDPIVPRLELVKTRVSNDRIRSLLSSRSFTENIEYIQPNCMDKLFDHTVSGNLRDVAGGDNRYPFALGMLIHDRTKNENQLALFSKQRGISIFHFERRWRTHMVPIAYHR
jgi:hypothetical protein